jgi:hypothetical protein
MNRPILDIEVKNRDHSYGHGPIDIAKRFIFARLDESENNDEYSSENDNDDAYAEVLVSKS